jgi:hypothetical protein
VLAKGSVSAYVGGSPREARCWARAYPQMVEMGSATGRENVAEITAGIGLDRMELHTETAASPARKRRLWTAQHVDGRTRGAKRARAIAAELARGWDGITPVQRQMLDRAAMLTALSEDLLARRLGGQPVSFDELLRAEGCAKRAVRAVLAERPVPPAPPRFSPMKVLREEAAKKKAKANAGKEAQREAVTEKALPDEHPTTD